ncbi:hypothetical protein ACNKHL_09700 [Shigella flexneri]
MPGRLNDQFADADILNYAGNVWSRREVFYQKVTQAPGSCCVSMRSLITAKSGSNRQEVIERRAAIRHLKPMSRRMLLPGPLHLTVCVNNELNWQTIPPGMVITDENGKKSGLTSMISLTIPNPSRRNALHHANTWVDDVAVVTHVARL